MVDGGGGRPPPKRMRVTYQVRDSGPDGDFRGGINALQLDETRKRLFSGGRDAVVREWDVSGTRSVEPTAATTFEGHTDWVNGLAHCGNIGILASASSDRTVKLWQIDGDVKDTDVCESRSNLQRTLRKHTDYVKAIAYAPLAKYLLSAGLDSHVYVWDMSAGTSTGELFASEVRHTDSVYALAVNHRGTVAALGAVNKVVRLWDPRTGNHFGTLQGHCDVIKALAVNEDGNRCLSGSSDNTLKLWDVGERRCLATYRPHSDSVWCVQTSSDFSRVVTGCRDGSVWCTNLGASGDHASTLVAKEPSAILALALTGDGGTVWASTVDATVRQWKIPDLAAADATTAAENGKGGIRGSDEATQCDNDSILDTSNAAQGVEDTVPGMGDTVPGAQGTEHGESNREGKTSTCVGVLCKSIMGRPALTRATILPDGQRVVTQDKAGCVALWDIVSGQHLLDCRDADFKTVLEEQSAISMAVKKWCSLDTSLGHISVHLEQDAFSAWIPATHLVALSDIQRREHRDVKVNLGGIVLQALLRHYQEGVQLAAFRTQQPSNESDDETVLADVHRQCVQQRTSHDWLCMKSSTPVHLSQTNSDPPMCLVRFTVDTAVECVSVLQTALPDWVHQCLFNSKGEPFGERGRVGSLKVLLVPRTVLAPEEARLPTISSGDLQVDETLLVSKMLTHVQEALSGPGASVGTVRLYCGKVLLTADMSAGYVHRKLWSSSKTLQLQYCGVTPTPGQG
eukprot:m.586179 g.586179  ORF g.586179 m.586179 type:complete len:740 (+) comp22340_c0_seq4:151-2370(+)